MRAELKTFICSDFDERAYWPDEEDNFGFHTEATIGPEGEDSEEIFAFQVCTPKWIATKAINQVFGDFGVFGRHMLIVTEYDWDKTKLLIAKLCTETTGENWAEIAHKLARYGAWEFADSQI
ncbi:MAG: Imm8 family immunity protein [Paracoccaceae bacterium]